MDMDLPPGRPVLEPDDILLDLRSLDEPFAVEWAVPPEIDDTEAQPAER